MPGQEIACADALVFVPGCHRTVSARGRFSPRSSDESCEDGGVMLGVRVSQLFSTGVTKNAVYRDDGLSAHLSQVGVNLHVNVQSQATDLHARWGFQTCSRGRQPNMTVARELLSDRHAPICRTAYNP